MTDKDEYACMSLEPEAIDDPIERALLVFTQWHVDEVTGGTEAATYAKRLVARLEEYGLVIRLAKPTPMQAMIDDDFMVVETDDLMHGNTTARAAGKSFFAVTGGDCARVVYWVNGKVDAAPYRTGLSMDAG